MREDMKYNPISHQIRESQIKRMLEVSGKKYIVCKII